MNFEELDCHMRRFETSLDQVILPELFIAVRIDGRNFTRLTKETCQFEAPFDIRFRDVMTDTAKHLMNCGFRIVYGYTQSDEISLLFHPEDNTFGRKTRKLNSVLAGEASSFFSLQLGVHGCFDSRVIPLPNVSCVKDYFSWRQEDAHRNSLNAHCYWLLRKEGNSPQDATKAIDGMSVADKNELLFSRGINYNNLPNWQKRGIGLYHTSYEKSGYNPIKKQEEISLRNKIEVNLDLETGENYTNWIISLLQISC